MVPPPPPPPSWSPETPATGSTGPTPYGQTQQTIPPGAPPVSSSTGASSHGAPGGSFQQPQPQPQPPADDDYTKLAKVLRVYMQGVSQDLKRRHLPHTPDIMWDVFETPCANLLRKYIPESRLAGTADELIVGSCVAPTMIGKGIDWWQKFKAWRAAQEKRSELVYDVAEIVEENTDGSNGTESSPPEPTERERESADLRSATHGGPFPVGGIERPKSTSGIVAG